MNPETHIRLAAHVRLRDDPVNGKRVMLYPEGALELEGTAATVADFCAQGMTLCEMLEALGEQFQGSPEEIRADLHAFLGELSARGFLKLTS